MGICGSKETSPTPAQSSNKVGTKITSDNRMPQQQPKQSSKNSDATICTDSSPKLEKESEIANASKGVTQQQQQQQLQQEQQQKQQHNQQQEQQQLQEQHQLSQSHQQQQSQLEQQEQYEQQKQQQQQKSQIVKPNTKDTKKHKQEAKVLLLGSGESGKSTILKQIKIIHQNGFTDREKNDYKPFIYKNICEAAESIVKALIQFDLVPELKESTSEDLDYISNYEVPMDSYNEPFDTEISSKIRKLIKEPVIDKLFNEHSKEFYIMDSSHYFFQNLDRISQQNYMPNTTDILRTRKQTSGIFDTKFQMEDIDIHLYDVGGQRSERKKWIHCFDNVTAVMFCVALSEYDQVLLESPTQNRLEESLNLFESVVNSMWFRRTSIILCLNKIDIFIEKLPKSPLEKYFPDYVGGSDVNKAVKYILWRFRQLNRANLNIVPYVTQATDTNNIKLAFAVVKETILHNTLMDSGIIPS